MEIKWGTNPQTRFAKPTIIPEANIAYPALRDSGAYIEDAGTLSNFVCRMIATMTPYIATASQKIILRQKTHSELELQYQEAHL